MHAACLLPVTLNDAECLGNVVLWRNLFATWLLKECLRHCHCLNCMPKTHLASVLMQNLVVNACNVADVYRCPMATFS